MKYCILVAMLSLGCSANRDLVARVSTSTTYHVAKYEHLCEGTGGKYPPSCVPCRDIINEAVWQAKVAETNVSQGYLPEQEVQDLERLLKELDTCP